MFLRAAKPPFLMASETETDFALFIAANDESGEAETTTTFHHLGAAIDEHHFFRETIVHIGTAVIAARATVVATLATTIEATLATALIKTTGISHGTQCVIGYGSGSFGRNGSIRVCYHKKCAN
jgi:hypothetical protein